MRKGKLRRRLRGQRRCTVLSSLSPAEWNSGWDGAGRRAMRWLEQVQRG
ncbi:MAG: hypothetical protein IPK19_41860 [Chloroflexi bacterium]|nr:hypothetical protein [Chloroflexota bacterium]